MSDRSKLIGVNLDKPAIQAELTEGDKCPACELGELALCRHIGVDVEGSLLHCLLCGQKIEAVNSAWLE